MKRKPYAGILAFVLLVLASGLVYAGQLPLASVRYFNPYQDPTNWSGWGSYIYQGGGATLQTVNGAVPVDNLGGTYAIVLDSVNPPGGGWNVLFKVSGNTMNYLRIGANPAVHLRLKWAAIPTNGAWNMALSLDANLPLNTANVPLSNYITPSTSVWQDIYIPVSDFTAQSPNLDLTHVWAIFLVATGNYTDHCILDIAAMDAVPSATQTNYAEFIKVNQAGYAPLMTNKIAIVSWEPGTITNAPTAFQVVNVTNSQVVFSGALNQIVPESGWNEDGDLVYSANFGALQTPGTYQVQVPALGASSPNFVIASNVYDKLFRDSLRFFYYSRSAEAITNPYAENFTRPAIHPDNTNASYNYDPLLGHYNFGAETTRDVHGCWFDAGDTHMDVMNTATACWYLLETARDFGQNVPPGSLDLPESNAQQGDLVPLISHGLDWLKLMQNSDGSVQTYVEGGSDDLTATQQVSDISSFATACAAAVFAKAYVVLGNSLSPADANDLLTRAQLAWSWLEANTNMVQPRLPLVNGVDPGGYDTSWGNATNDLCDRAFAAVELFEATGAAEYNNYFVTNFQANGNTPLNGPVFGVNTTGYQTDEVMGYLTGPLNFTFMDYVRSGRNVNTGIQAILQSAFLHQAALLTNYTLATSYQFPLLYPGHLYWGSSGNVLSASAIVLARAFQWTGNEAFHEAAMNALHFICGRNPVNRIFVSGYSDYQHGSDFYSQFWTNLVAQPPGYLGAYIDVAGSAVPVVTYPWKRFINTQDADMTEPGVYWNSPFAWLTGYAMNDALPPALAIAPGTNGITLTWPLRSSPVALYGATNVSSPAAWTLATNPPALSNGIWLTPLQVGTSGQNFYRLRLP